MEAESNKWTPPAILGVRERNYIIADTPKKLHYCFNQLRNAKKVAFDIETSHAIKKADKYHIHPTQAKVLGIAFCWDDYKACYIPIYLNDTGETYFQDPHTFQMVVKEIKKILENPDIFKIAHNGKFDCVYLKRCLQIDVKGFEFDTMIAHYLINENGMAKTWSGLTAGCSHGLDIMAKEYLGEDAVSAKEYGNLVNEVSLRDPHFHRYQTVPVPILGKYACGDTDDTWMLHKIMEKKLQEEDLLNFFYNFEMLKTRLLIMAELEGIPTNIDEAVRLSGYFEEEMSVIRTTLREITNIDFDPAHPGDTKEVLFKVLGLKPEKMGKSGQASTDNSVIEQLLFKTKASLRDITQNIDLDATSTDDLKAWRESLSTTNKHKATQFLVLTLTRRYRNLFRNKANYAGAIHKYYDSRRKVFAMDYRAHITATGRLSSPIIQSMPSSAKGGKLVRGMFNAGQGNKFVFVDFSQMELRVMAEISGDKNMIDAFKKGEDIHTATAKKMLNVDDEWIKTHPVEWKDIRRKAKTINFGILFGEGAKKLGASLQIEKEEAEDLIEKYLSVYPDVKACIERVHNETGKTGIVRLPLGRVRHLPDIIDLQLQLPKFDRIFPSLRGVLADGDANAPSCYKGQSMVYQTPLMSGHLGLRDELLIHLNKKVPFSAKTLQDRIVYSPHKYKYPKCVNCPYIVPCVWEAERVKRRLMLYRNQRQAFSSLIQGTAVDMCFDSMFRIQDRIVTEKIPANTQSGLAVQVLQVHDEIGVVVREDYADYMAKVMQEEMERWPNDRWPNFTVPIVADPEKPMFSWGDK